MWSFDVAFFVENGKEKYQNLPEPLLKLVSCQRRSRCSRRRRGVLGPYLLRR